MHPPGPTAAFSADRSSHSPSTPTALGNGPILVGTDMVSAWRVAFIGQQPYAASAHPLPLLLRCSMRKQGKWSSEHLLEPERVSRVRPIRLRWCTVFSRPACGHHGSAVNITSRGAIHFTPDSWLPGVGKKNQRQPRGQRTVCNVDSLDPLASSIRAGVIHTLPPEAPLASHLSRLSSSSVFRPVGTTPSELSTDAASRTGVA